MSGEGGGKCEMHARVFQHVCTRARASECVFDLTNRAILLVCLSVQMVLLLEQVTRGVVLSPSQGR